MSAEVCRPAWDLYYRVNVGGMITLLEAMQAQGVGRLVFSSTCATYGEPETLPILETAAQRPVSPYGRSKLMAEDHLGRLLPPPSSRWSPLRYFTTPPAWI